MNHRAWSPEGLIGIEYERVADQWDADKSKLATRFKQRILGTACDSDADRQIPVEANSPTHRSRTLVNSRMVGRDGDVKQLGSCRR